MGWQALENGALLSAAEEAAFDLLLTCDQSRIALVDAVGPS